jgi:predicted dehydrogenase
MPQLEPPVKAAIVGYRMGVTHADLIGQVDGLEVAAVCDTDPERLRLAREQLGQVATYEDVEQVAADEQVQLVVVVTPHSAHLPCALPCLEAGKHVVVEKPMALTVAECTAMIEAARQAGVTLSVFHNRRWDGPFVKARQVIRDGYIGDVFHVEAHFGGYHPPSRTWRGRKGVSGGLFYDWGAHVTDWTLGLLEGRRMAGVTGQFQKRVWDESTNEDHVEAFIRFDDGAVAHVQISQMAAAGKPRFYVLGTKGALVNQWDGPIEVRTRVGRHTATFTVDCGESHWPAYYQGLADHLTADAPNPVTPESARRVIAVFETAERSSQEGGEQPVPYES